MENSGGGKEELSLDIDDWIIEEELTALSGASKLTGLPIPRGEEPLEGCINRGNTLKATTAEADLRETEEPFPFNNIMLPSVSPSIPGTVVQGTSKQQAGPLIQSDPEKIIAARKALQRRKTAARRTERRIAHTQRPGEIKRKRSQSNSEGTFGGPQNLPPINDYMPTSSLNFAPMHDCWSTVSGKTSESAALGTLEPAARTTPEILGIVHSTPKKSRMQDGREFICQGSAPLWQDKN